METRYADVSKLFSYGIETTNEYPETRIFRMTVAYVWREQVKSIEKRRDDCKFNLKIMYGVL